MLNRREMIVAELNERLVNAVARCLRFYLPPMPPTLAVPSGQPKPTSVSSCSANVAGTSETSTSRRVSSTDVAGMTSASTNGTAGASPATAVRAPPPGTGASPRSRPSPGGSSSPSSSFSSDHPEDEANEEVGSGSGGGGAAAQSTTVLSTSGGDGDASTRGGIDYEALIAVGSTNEPGNNGDDDGGGGYTRHVHDGKSPTDALLRQWMGQELAGMPVITVKAYDAILTCLDVLRMLVRNGHISVNPMNLLFTVPAATTASAVASASTPASADQHASGYVCTGDAVSSDAAGRPPADTCVTNTSAGPLYEAPLPKPQCDLYTLLHQLVYQTRYGPLASAALRLFSACVHYNVRDMVPLLAERGLLNTVLAIARRPHVCEEAVTTAQPLRFALDTVEENGAPNIPRRELLQASSTSLSPAPSLLLLERPSPDLLMRYVPAEDAYLNAVAVRMVLPEFVEAMTVHKATHLVFSKHTEWVTALTRSLTVTPSMSSASLLDIKALFDEAAEACTEHEANDLDSGGHAAIDEDEEGHQIPRSAPLLPCKSQSSVTPHIDHQQQQQQEEGGITQRDHAYWLLRCHRSTAYEQLLNDLKTDRKRCLGAFAVPAADSSTSGTHRVACHACYSEWQRLPQRTGGTSHSAAVSTPIDVVLTCIVELHRLHLKREEVSYKTLQGAVKEVQRVLTEVLQSSPLIMNCFAPALRSELSLLRQRTHAFAQAVRAGATHPHPFWGSTADGDEVTATGQSDVASSTSGSGASPRTRADYIHLLVQAIEVCRTLNNFFAFFSALDWDRHQRRYRLSRRSAEQQASQQELAMVLESTVCDFHVAVNQLWSLMGSHAPLQLHNTNAVEATDPTTAAGIKERQATLDERHTINRYGHTLLTCARLGNPLRVYEQGNADGASSLLSYIQATIGSYLHARIFGDYLRSAPPSTRMEATLKSTVQCILHFSSRDFIGAPELVMARGSGTDGSGSGGAEAMTDAEGALSKKMRRRCLKLMKRALEGPDWEAPRHCSNDAIQQPRSIAEEVGREGGGDAADNCDGAQGSADRAAAAERVYYHTSESPCKDVISSVLRPLSVGDGIFLRQLLEAWRVSTSGSSGSGGGSNGPGRRDSEATPWRSIFSEIMEFVVDALVVRASYTADDVAGLLRSLQAGTQHGSVSTGILSLYDRNAEVGVNIVPVTPATLPAATRDHHGSEEASVVGGIDASDQILQSMLQDGRSLLNEPSTAWMTAEAWAQATTSTTGTPATATGDGSLPGPSSAAEAPQRADASPVARAEAAGAGASAPSEALPHSAFPIVVPSVLTDPHARGGRGHGGRRDSPGGINHGVDSEDSVDSSTTLSSSLPMSTPPTTLAAGAVGDVAAVAGLDGSADGAGSGDSGAEGGRAAAAAAAAAVQAGASPLTTPLFSPINAARALQQWLFLSLFTGRRVADQPTRNFFYLSPYRRDGHARPALPLNVTGLLRTIRSDMQAAFEDAVRGASADAGDLSCTPGDGAKDEPARQAHPSRARAKWRNSTNSDEEVSVVADLQERLHMFRPQPRYENRAGTATGNSGTGGGYAAFSSARVHTACEWFDLDARELASVSLPSRVNVEAFLRDINFVEARHVLWELAVLGAVCTGGNGAASELESTPLHDMLSRAAQFMILLSRLVFAGDAESAKCASAAAGGGPFTSTTTTTAAAPLSPAATALKDQLQRLLVYMAVLLMNFLEGCDARTRGRHATHVESLLYCILDVWPRLPGFPMVPHVYLAAVEVVAQLKPETLSRMSFQALAPEWRGSATKTVPTTTSAATIASTDAFSRLPSPQLREREETVTGNDEEEGEDSDLQHSSAEEICTTVAGDVSRRFNRALWSGTGPFHNGRVGAPSPSVTPIQAGFSQYVARLQPRRSQLGSPLSVANEWGRALPWVCDIAAGRIFPLDTLSETGYRLLRKRVCRALWGMWTSTNAAEQQYVLAYMLHRVLSNVRENIVLLEYVGVLLTQLRGVVLVEALALTPLPRAIVKVVRQAIQEVTAEQHEEEVCQQALSSANAGAAAAAQREFRQRRRRFYARTQMTLHGQLVSFLSVFQNVRSDAPLVTDPLARTAATASRMQALGGQCSYFDATRNTFCWNGHQCHRQHVVPVNGQRGQDGEDHRFGLNTFGLGTQRALDEVLSVLEHHGFPCPLAMPATATAAQGSSSTAETPSLASVAEGAETERHAALPSHASSTASDPAQSTGQPQAHQPSQRVVRVPLSAGTAEPNAAPSRPQDAYRVERRTWQGDRAQREQPSVRGYVPAVVHSNRDGASADVDEGTLLTQAASATVDTMGLENRQRLLRGEGLPWLPLSAQPAPSSSSMQQLRGGLSGPRDLDYGSNDTSEEAQSVFTHLVGTFGGSRRERSPLRHRLLNPLTSADFRADPLRRSIIPHCALFSRDVCEEVVRMVFDFMAFRLRDEAADKADAEAARREQQQQQQQQDGAGSASVSALSGNMHSPDVVLSTSPQFSSSPMASPLSTTTLPFSGVLPASTASHLTTAKAVAARLTLPRVEVVECGVDEVMVHFLLICFSTYYTTCMHLTRTHRPAGAPTPPAATYLTAARSTAPASSRGASADATSGYGDSLSVLCAYITHIDPPNREKAMLLSGLLLTDMVRLEEDMWQHMVTVLRTTVQVHHKGRRLTEKAYAALSAHHLRLTRASASPLIEPSSSLEEGKAPVATARRNVVHRRPRSQAYVPVPSASGASHQDPSAQLEGLAEQRELHADGGAAGASNNGDAEAAIAVHHYLIPLSIFLANLEPYIVRHPIAFHHAFRRYCEVRWVRAATGEMPAAWLGVWVRPRPPAAAATATGSRSHSPRVSRRPRCGAGATPSRDFVERVQCFVQHLAHSVDVGSGRATHGASMLAVVVQLPGVCEALLSPSFEMPVPSMYAKLLTSTAGARETPASSTEALAAMATLSGEGEVGLAASIPNGDCGAPALSPQSPLIAVPPFLALALYFCSALGEAGRGTSSGGGPITGSVDFATVMFAHDPIAVSEVVVRTLGCLVTALEAKASSRVVVGGGNNDTVGGGREGNGEGVAVSTRNGLAEATVAPAAQQQQQVEGKERVRCVKKTLTRCLHDVLCFLERGSPQPATAALPARQRATQQRMGVNSAVQESFLRFFDHLGRLGLLDLLFRVCLLQSCEHGRDATSLLQLLAHQLLALGQFNLAEMLSPSQRRYAAQMRDVQQQHRLPRGLSRTNLWMSQGGAPASLRRPYPGLHGQELVNTLDWLPSRTRGVADPPGLRHAFDHLEALLARDTIRSGGDGTVQAADTILEITSSFAGERGMNDEVPEANELRAFLTFQEEEEEPEVEMEDNDVENDDDDDDGAESGSRLYEHRGSDEAATRPESPPALGDTDAWTPMHPVRRARGMQSVQNNDGNEEEPNANARASVRTPEDLQQTHSVTARDAAVRSGLSNDEGRRHRRVVSLATYEEAVIRSLRAEEAMGRHRRPRQDGADMGEDEDAENVLRSQAEMPGAVMLSQLSASRASTDSDRRREEDNGSDDDNGDDNHTEEERADSGDDNGEENESTQDDEDETYEEDVIRSLRAEEAPWFRQHFSEEIAICEEWGAENSLRSQAEIPGAVMLSQLSASRSSTDSDRHREEDNGSYDDNDDDDNDDDDNGDDNHTEEERADSGDDNGEESESTQDDEDETYEEEDEEDDASLYYEAPRHLAWGRDYLENALLDMYTPEMTAGGGDSGALRHGLAQQTAGSLTYLNDELLGRPSGVPTAMERAQSFAACAYRAILLAVRPLAAHNVVETETPPLPVLHAFEEEAPTEAQVQEPSCERIESNDGGADLTHLTLADLHHRSVRNHNHPGSPSLRYNPATLRAITTATPTSALHQHLRRPLSSTTLPSPFLAVEAENTPSDQVMRRGRDSRSPLDATAPSTVTQGAAAAESASSNATSPTPTATSQPPSPQADNREDVVEVQREATTTSEADTGIDVLTARIIALFAAGDTNTHTTAPAESLPPQTSAERASTASEQPTSATVATAATLAPAPPAAPEPWEGTLNPQFLIEMPEDVRSEILFDSMNVLRGADERELRGQRTRLYPGFLDSLPEDAQRHAMEVEARWVRVTGADNNASELYQTLLLVDAETRRDLLLQCDLELLRSYPEVLREATELRAEVERAREEAEQAAQRQQERRQRQREQAEQLQQQQASQQQQSRLWMPGAWDTTRDVRSSGATAASAAAPATSGTRTSLPALRDMETVDGVMRVMFGYPSPLYEVINYELFLARRLYRCEMVLQSLEPLTSLFVAHSMGLYPDRAAEGSAPGLMLSPLLDENVMREATMLNYRHGVHRGGNAMMRRAPPRGASMAAASNTAGASHYHLPQFPSLQLPPSADLVASDSPVSPLSPPPHTLPSGAGDAFSAQRSASGSHVVAAPPSTSLAALSECMVPVQETSYHPLALPLPDVPEDIVVRCIELLRLRATAPLALPCNLLTGISCLDQELQRFMQLLVSDTNTAARVACELLDLMAATPTSTAEDVSLERAAGFGKVANTSAATRAPTLTPATSLSNASCHLSTNELSANRQFIKDVTTLLVALVKQNQAMVFAFFLLPDNTVDTATLKPLDAPLDAAEQRVVQYGLWNRLWRVARQHVHVPSFALALDKLLQQLVRCQRSISAPFEDNELANGVDPNASEALTETLIEHPRHPHRLRWMNIRLLSNYEDGSFVCNVCGANPGADHCFHCASCQFDLCANCSRERLTLTEMQQRTRRAAALMLQNTPETVTSMMRLLRHPLCRPDIAINVVHLMSFGLRECGVRESVGLFSGDATAAGSGTVGSAVTMLAFSHSASSPLHNSNGSVRGSPIQLLEQELVELADARVRALKAARDEFRHEVYSILHPRPGKHGHNAGVGVAVASPTRSQSGGGANVSRLAGRHTWQQLSIPEGYIFDTDTAMALLVKLDINDSEGDAIQLLFEPYVATMRSEPRAFTMLWRASQAYLLDVSTLLEHVAPKEVLPLPSCVSSILQTFCKYHLSESRLLGASSSARTLTDSRNSLAGETEHFLRASTKPSSVSDRAVRELAEQADAAQWMTAAGTRLSEEGPKSAEEMQHRRLPRVVQMVLEENRTTLNTLLHWDGNLLKDSFSFLKYEPNLIDFDFKLTDFRRRLGARRGPNILLRVNRQTCLLDSFKELQKVKSFGGQLHIRFHGEEGADAGGLTREWLQLLSEAIVDERYALFIHSQDSISFQPNPFSSVNPNHLEYFQFAGVVTGLAIAHNVPIDIHFTRAFYRHIIGHRPVFSDLQSFDPELYTNLNWIMENDVTDLGLTFAVNYDRFGSVEEAELEPNGKDTAVTDANKQQYVRLLCEFYMTKRTEDQLLRFLKGFYSVIPRREIQCFTEKELELVISGMPNIDVEDLRTHTVYEGYSSTSPQVRWFWEAVGSMSKEDLANLLQFTTGSSKVPHGGFGHLEGSNGRSLPFTISRWAVNKDDLLPQAHTCFNKIDLPVYTSAAVLKQKLMLAITYGSMGFTMV
ncbi:ubiquitin-protein ligase-like, putative [Leishmania tarentolae]|uniref:HECT-type E3 ubiquitin transferase n=1 Tax=Leishmania tarentolae TaxID=5689 RepID=A0A640KAJ7_LEITA|nr:ubiquitin-protein ligase-like, putative [Leishmania tarentolae]